MFTALKIVDPYPKNQVLIEGESTKISCSFVDSSEHPTITFQRRPDGINFEDIKINERVYVTNSTTNTTEGSTKLYDMQISCTPFILFFSFFKKSCYALNRLFQRF